MCFSPNLGQREAYSNALRGGKDEIDIPHAMRDQLEAPRVFHLYFFFVAGAVEIYLIQISTSFSLEIN